MTFGSLTPLIVAWVGFGLFTIGAGVLVALHADRLSHRRRLAVMANYFEHVLELPLAFHTSTHSGRVLKVMLEGSNGMAWLWLGFFREHLAALVALVILLPLTVFLNWRLGLLLVLLVVVFTVLTTIVLRKTETLQGSVERYHSSLAEHASDALGNVPVIQSFTRDRGRDARAAATSSTSSCRPRTRSCPGGRSPPSRRGPRRRITVTAIFLVGTWLHLTASPRIGEVVTFMSIATMLIGRLEQAVSFVNQLFMQAPKMREFFEILDTAPAVHDRPARQEHRAASAGDVAFEDVSFSYDGKRSAVQDVSFTVRPGETVALVGATGSGKSTTLGLLHRAFDPQSGVIRIDGDDIRDLTLVLAPAQYRRGVPGADAVRPLDPREPPGRPARRHRRGDDRGARARPGASSSSPARRTGSTRSSASAAARCRAASASACRSPARS